MENLSYVGISQQMALQQQMEMTANNLANMGTAGFKAQNILFTNFTAPQSGGTAKQVRSAGSYRDLTTGALAQTHNQLDVAIDGDGYFSIQSPDGLRYTRDGGFSLNSSREIVNKSGYPVLSDSGSAIVVPREASQIMISEDGQVSGPQGAIGRLKVTGFDNPQKLKPIGHNLYEGGGAVETPLEHVRVAQGAIEQSNVNPVIEMNKMVQLLRMYQTAQRTMQGDHERLRNMIQKLTQA